VEAYYGKGLALTGPNYDSLYFNCVGNESSLINCNKYTNSNCDHQKDVIVFC
jgi:hypothetical protein